MMKVVTDDVINGIYEICIHELKQLIPHQETEKENRLRLEIDAIIPILAWQILVPFLIALTSKLTSEKLVSKQLKKKSIAELRGDVFGTVGKIIRLENPDDMEEAVILIEELLQPFRVTRQQARHIVKLLNMKIEQSDHND